MNLGKVFRQERERLGISQREMAYRLSLTPAALWKIEASRTWPKPQTIWALCRETGCPIARFYIDALDPTDY